MNETQLSESIASAPHENEVIFYEPFQKNLYPKLPFQEYNSHNYKINRIMHQYKYLDEERIMRNRLKKKYKKVSNASFGIECFITASELGTVAASFVVPILVPISIPLSVGLTTIMAALRSTSGIIDSKINKHSAIELLAESKLNSIEEKFGKVIKDGKITEEEFNDIENEIKNFNKMKASILSEFKKGKRNPSEIGNELKLSLLEKGKTIGRAEAWDSFRKELHK